MRRWNSKFWRAARARQDPFPIRKIQSCSTAQMLGDRGAKMGDIRYRVPKLWRYEIWRYECPPPFWRRRSVPIGGLRGSSSQGVPAVRVGGKQHAVHPLFDRRGGWLRYYAVPVDVRVHKKSKEESCRNISVTAVTVRTVHGCVF